MKIIYVPWSKGIEYCYKLASMILDDGLDIDVIVAVSRGGLIPARIVSDVLGVDELIVVRSRFWGIGVTVREEPEISVFGEMHLGNRNVLVVDDVTDTGATLTKITKLINSYGAKSIKTGVLHYKATSRFKPDYYVEKLEEWAWILYPWSLSEALYSLTKTKSGGTIDNVIKILKELGAFELYLDPVRLLESIKRYQTVEQLMLNKSYCEGKKQ